MKKILWFLLLIPVLSACQKEDLVDTTLNEIKDVNGLDAFKSEISSGISLVFFHASWCKICKEQRPAVESLAANKEASFAKILEMEYDDNKETVKAFEVTGFPTLVAYKDGKEVQRWKGKGHSEETLLQGLKSHR
jgi:thioredoxin 1